MLISVIIPAYNRVGTIARALESALAQTHEPLEIIVVDDGSTDGTAEFISSRFDGRLRLIRQRNAGPSAARNTGIRAAQGQIIAFLDSDDAWLPEKLARQVSLLQLPAFAKATCCICNSTMVYRDGSQKTSFGIAGLHPVHAEGLWINPAEVLLSRFLLFNQAVAVRRDALDCVGFFREDFRIMEDYDLALRLALTGPWAFVADPLVLWYGGAENSLTTAATGREIALRSHQILHDLRGSPTIGGVKSQIIERRLRVLRIRIFADRMRSGSKTAEHLLGAAIFAFLRVYEAVIRRLPSFPRMLTVPSELRPISRESE